MFLFNKTPQSWHFSYFFLESARFPFDMADFSIAQNGGGKKKKPLKNRPTKTCHQETVNVIKNSFTVPLIWNAQCKLLWPAIVDEIAAPLVNQVTNTLSHKKVADDIFVYFGYPPSQDTIVTTRMTKITWLQAPGV